MSSSQECTVEVARSAVTCFDEEFIAGCRPTQLPLIDKTYRPTAIVLGRLGLRPEFVGPYRHRRSLLIRPQPRPSVCLSQEGIKNKMKMKKKERKNLFST